MMRAVAVHPGTREVGFVAIDAPRLNADARTSVKIRILEVGVCGTDKEICRFEYSFPPPTGSDFLVLGHESLGEVVEIGPDVTTVQPGDLVVATVRRPCSSAACGACLSERQDFCSTGNYIERGIKELHGFMTGFVVEDERYICKLPSSLREIGVLAEPLTVTEKALQQLESVQSRLPWLKNTPVQQPQRNALVLGAGPVGLLAAMALVVRGFRTFVYSREPENDSRAAICSAAGVEYVSSSTTSVRDLEAAIPGSIDLVYEATGLAPLAFEVLRCLGPNGVYIFTGIAGKRPPVPFDLDGLVFDMVLKNQVLMGTVNADRQAFVTAISDLALFQQRFPSAIQNLITRRYAMDQHQDLLLGRAGGIKNIISMEGAV